MMRIKVVYSSQLAWKIGVSEQPLDLPEGATLRAAIQALADQHGEALSTLIFSSGGADILRSLLVAVEGEQVHAFDQTILQEGNELMLLMPIAGG